MLKKLGLDISLGKTQKATTEEGFEFLGIDLSNGFIRPSKNAQDRLRALIESILTESETAFREHKKTEQILNQFCLLESLKKVSGVMQGWGKHYWFCNDKKCFERLDQEVALRVRKYLAVYRDERDKTDETGWWRLLGIESLAQIERDPFCWPKKNRELSKLMKAAIP